jgi:hypothetical protein
MKFSKVANRKLLATIALYITATACLFFDKTTFSEWSEFMIWIFGIYATGNVAEHATKKIGVKISAKENEEVAQ